MCPSPPAGPLHLTSFSLHWDRNVCHPLFMKTTQSLANSYEWELGNRAELPRCMAWAVNPGLSLHDLHQFISESCRLQETMVTSAGAERNPFLFKAKTWQLDEVGWVRSPRSHSQLSLPWVTFEVQVRVRSQRMPFDSSGVTNRTRMWAGTLSVLQGEAGSGLTQLLEL